MSQNQNESQSQDQSREQRPGQRGADHTPVLVREVLTQLDPQAGDICLDCTAGRGGHATALIPKLLPDGRYIGLDADAANIDFCRSRLADAPVQVDLIHSNFGRARSVLDDLGVGRVDLILADLGFASVQMADASRGFSFNQAGALDMRYDMAQPTTAADLVNTLSEQDLADVLWRYGEERLSRKIARKIVEQRAGEPIKTTGDLAQIVRKAYGPRPKGTKRRRGPSIDPATRTFMALRIAVNAELDALEQLLAQLPRLIKPGGRAVVISFHSLEDRPVKHYFKQLKEQGLARVLTKKPMTASDDERESNPRSRSAKLRAVMFLAADAGRNGAISVASAWTV